MVSSTPLLDPAALAAACADIAGLAPRTAAAGPWHSGAFAALADHGLLAAFVPADCGGGAADEPTLLGLLAAVAERCLTTALALSQWAAAVRIIAQGEGTVRHRFLPPLARGEGFTTVGISQLTTSRQHGGTPVVRGVPQGDWWQVDGHCPWVTGADCCRTIVTGAVVPGGDQCFFVVATDAPGVDVAPPLPLLALEGSRTTAVRLSGVRPLAVIRPRAGTAARTGGLATTALALGGARAALAFMADEASARPGLAAAAAGLTAEAEAVAGRLAAAARDGIAPADRDRLRADANSLVVRAAQAALTAAKGAGFVRGHPAERLVRESLFFLVWSCPQAVATATLCELAGLDAAAAADPIATAGLP